LLARIRSYLAGSTRTRTTLTECERLLSEARACAMYMYQMAPPDSPLQMQAHQRLDRDLGPLATEVQRQLHDMMMTRDNNASNDLFYQPPHMRDQQDLESLIASSEDLLRESHSILADTEMIGTSTLQQMGRQREQLQNATTNLEAVQNVAFRAKTILTGMSRRALKNKLCLYFLIAALTAANMYVLVLIFKKQHRKLKGKN
jgi:vesicle transport through interaction with t-SNAREs 1